MVPPEAPTDLSSCHFAQCIPRSDLRNKSACCPGCFHPDILKMLLLQRSYPSRQFHGQILRAASVRTPSHTLLLSPVLPRGSLPEAVHPPLSAADYSSAWQSPHYPDACGHNILLSLYNFSGHHFPAPTLSIPSPEVHPQNRYHTAFLLFL